MAKLKQYHFSLGNSTNGPIGFCALIKAESKAEAVALLKKSLPQEQDVHPYSEDGNAAPEIVYIAAYFNEAAITEAAITEADIDEEEEVD